MSKKFFDFIFSFGFMIGGVGLLFLGSVTLAKTPQPLKSFVGHFPIAGVRAMEGGDITAVVSASHPSIPLSKNKESFGGNLTAAAAVVVDDETNAFLFKKNSDSVRSLASVTKLMSALALNDLALDWSTTTVITEEDIDPGSHQLNIGEKFTLEDLWQVALIGSSNSAIHALVRSSGLTEEQFVERMNAKAVQLRLSTLRFVEPTGLNNHNMGSSTDVARLLHEALKVDKIYKTLRIGEYYAEPLNKNKKRRIWTTNWLLTNWVPNNFEKDTLVGKTGYILDSGYNFVVRISDKRGHAVRVAVLGADTNEARFSEARDLAEWAFAEYVWPDEAEYDQLVE